MLIVCFFAYKKLTQFAVRGALPPRRSESPVCATDNKPSCVLHLLGWFIGSCGFSSLERRPEFWVLQTKTPTVTSEVPGAKTGYHTWPLHRAAPNGGQTPKTPLRPKHQSAPTFTLFRETAHQITSPHPPQLTPTKASSKGTCYLFSLSCATAGLSVKSCLNFSSGFLSISIN